MGCETYGGEALSEATTRPTLTREHTALSEAEALKFLEGHRITLGGRTMDLKAQIIGEFVSRSARRRYACPI